MTQVTILCVFLTIYGGLTLHTMNTILEACRACVGPVEPQPYPNTRKTRDLFAARAGRGLMAGKFLLSGLL